MACMTGDFTSFRFSAESLLPEPGLPMWHEALTRSFGGRRILSPLSDGPFRVEMTVHQLGLSGNCSDTHAGACIARVAVMVGGTARRTPELLSDGNDDAILHIHETGRRTVSQLGREATAGPGAGLLLSNADTSTTVVPGPSRFAGIRVPRKPMMALAPGFEDAFVRPLPPGSGVLRLLVRYLDILDDEDALRTPELRRVVAAHIHDLCALAIGASRDAAEIAKGRGLRAARMRAIKAEIARSLLQGGTVSAAALARAQRVSPRYIQKLFENEGTTLSKFVLGQRLARVHRMLTDPRMVDLTIGAIAYRAGFGDLSTFNREFRRQFGATPSDIRAATRGGAALRPWRGPRDSDPGSAESP
jgi:AraC-like DNA-binding protein